MSQYRYCWGSTPTVTEATMETDAGGSVAICPDFRDNEDTYVGFTDDEGNEGGMCFTPAELNDFIADLQRARSGCFIGEWPRPPVVRTSSKCTFATVGELRRFLEPYADDVKCILS